MSILNGFVPSTEADLDRYLAASQKPAKVEEVQWRKAAKKDKKAKKEPKLKVAKKIAVVKADAAKPRRQKYAGADFEIQFLEHRNVYIGFFGGQIVVTRPKRETCEKYLQRFVK